MRRFDTPPSGEQSPYVGVQWRQEDVDLLRFLIFSNVPRREMPEIMQRGWYGIRQYLKRAEWQQDAMDELWDDHDCLVEGCREAWAKIQKEALG